LVDREEIAVRVLSFIRPLVEAASAALPFMFFASAPFMFTDSNKRNMRRKTEQQREREKVGAGRLSTECGCEGMQRMRTWREERFFLS